MSVSVSGHSGRTDSSGGHYNRSTGVYHYHNGGSSSSSTSKSTPVQPSISVPINFKTTSTHNSITISWSPVTNAGSYEVSVNGEIRTTIETSITYSGLVPNTVYEYAVKAKSNNVSGNYSAVYTIKTGAEPQPEPAVPVQQSKIITVIVDGVAIVFNDQQPEIINDTVMVPIRNVVEKMDCALEWDNTTQTIYINDLNTLLIKNGHKTNNINICVNNEPILFENQHPVIINGRTLTPVRSVVEKLKYSVSWDSDSMTVNITKN